MDHPQVEQIEYQLGVPALRCQQIFEAKPLILLGITRCGAISRINPAFPLPARAMRTRQGSARGGFPAGFSRYGIAGTSSEARSGRRGLGPARAAAAICDHIQADQPGRTRHSASRRARGRRGERRPIGGYSDVGGCGSCAVLSLPSAFRFAAIEVRHDGFFAPAPSTSNTSYVDYPNLRYLLYLTSDTCLILSHFQIS